MRQYELTYLVSDKVSEGDLNKITGKVGGDIADFGGKILKEEIWKRRKLAYPINKQQFATYVSINFELPREKVREFEQDIRITPEIIRHLLIVKDMGEEEFSLTADEIAGTEDIEEVIGGEKSFEMVEGETEDSRDLMAKREQEEEQEESGIKNKESGKTAKEPTTEEPVAEEKQEEEPKVKKSRTKKSIEKVETAAKEQAAEDKEQATEEPKKPARKRTKPTVSSESERLAKLDEELDNLLKEDL